MKTSSIFTTVISIAVALISFIMQGCAGEEIRVAAINQDGVHYEIENNEAIATGYIIENGDLKNYLNFPEKIVSYNLSFNVVAVADRAFIGGQWQSVTFGVNIRSIGEEAFAGCKNIIAVRPEGDFLPSLPENAFDQEVYENAYLLINQGVDVKGTVWDKFINVKIMYVKTTY